MSEALKQNSLGDPAELEEIANRRANDITMRRYFLKDPKGNDRFAPRLLAAEIALKHPFIYTENLGFYMYEDGVYVPYSVQEMDRLIRRTLGRYNTTSYMVAETISYMRAWYLKPETELNPDHRYVNFKNGMLNIETGDLLPHDPKYLSTIRINAVYDPLAQCFAIDEFINATCRPEDVNFLYEWFAYCIFVPDCRYEKLLLMYGKGGNGKSKIIELLLKLIDKNAVCTIPPQRLSGSTDKAQFNVVGMVNKTLNAVPDIPSTALRNLDVIKSLVSGELIDAAYKRENSFSFRNKAKQMFSCNTLPDILDWSDSIKQRMIIMDFPNKFRGTDKADINILEKLTTPQELSGLINRIYEGYHRLILNGGFSPTYATETVLEQYKERSNPVLRFIQSECVTGQYMALKPRLFNTFTSWMQDYCPKEQYIRKGEFYERLAELGFKEKRTSDGRYVLGIKISDSSDYAPPTLSTIRRRG